MDQKNQLFHTIEEHLLYDEKPSLFLKELFEQDKSKKIPFSFIGKLKHIEQSPVHHPEGSVWNHTMLVVDYAATLRLESKEPKVLMWAALLHDIGKTTTTKIRKGKITSYNHDKVGAELASDFLNYFTLEADFKSKVVNLVRYHMHILYVIKNLPFQNRYELIRATDLDELALLGFADRMGRLHVKEDEVRKDIETFKQIMCTI